MANYFETPEGIKYLNTVQGMRFRLSKIKLYNNRRENKFINIPIYSLKKDELQLILNFFDKSGKLKRDKTISEYKKIEGEIKERLKMKNIKDDDIKTFNELKRQELKEKEQQLKNILNDKRYIVTKKAPLYIIVGGLNENDILQYNNFLDVYNSPLVRYLNLNVNDAIRKEITELEQNDIYQIQINVLYILLIKRDSKGNYIFPYGINPFLSDNEKQWDILKVHVREGNEIKAIKNMMSGINVISNEEEYIIRSKTFTLRDYKKSGAYFNYSMLDMADSQQCGNFVLGYNIYYTNDDINTNDIIDKIYSLKAFKPCTDRKYIDETLCSTINDNKCLYNTWFYIENIKLGENMKKYKELIDESFKNEPKNVQNMVKNGEAFNFIKYKAIECKKSYILEIYKPINDILAYKITQDIDIPYIKITNNNNIDILNATTFLYYNEHVAPHIVSYKEEKPLWQKKKEENKKILAPIKIKDNKKDKKIYHFCWDIETYKNNNGDSIPYCICLYSGDYKGNEIKIKYYGNNCIEEFINYLRTIYTPDVCDKTRPKNAREKLYLWSFNGDNFDNIFIFKELIKDINFNYYIIDGQGVKMMKYHNIKFMDMRKIYMTSLAKLASSFKIDMKKGVMCYKFVNEDTLYYNGDIPNLKYWNNEDDYKTYKNEIGVTFDMQEHTLNYCMQDCEVLYKCLKKHLNICVYERIDSKGIIRKIDVSGKGTQASISLETFKQGYLTENIYPSPYKHIEREAYYGGLTVVMRTHYNSSINNDKMHIYDINSSYPSALTHLMPTHPDKHFKFEPREFNKIDEIIDTNFYHVVSSEYQGNDKHFINIFVKRYDGKISSSENMYDIWAPGCTLKTAIKQNSKIICDEIITYKTTYLFKEYIEELYNKRKANSEKKGTPEYCSVKDLALKLLMNSLYGKFGQKAYKMQKFIRTYSEYRELLKEFIIDDIKPVDHDSFDLLIKYHGENDEDEALDNFIRFPAYVTALGRCKLIEGIMAVGYEHVYYMDTDSIHTTKELPEELISDTILGKFKKEAEVCKAIYLAPKTYYYEKDSYIVYKNKGNALINVKLSAEKENKTLLEKYEETLNGKNWEIENKTKFQKRLIKGTVEIKEEIKNVNKVLNRRIFHNDGSSSPYKKIEDIPLK